MSLSIRAYARHRGVSDAAVRKAIKTGRITPNPDGTLDPDRADREWDNRTDAAQQRAPPRASSSSTFRDAAPESPAPGGTTFVQARTANEVLKAQTNKVRLARLKGELIDRSQAIAHVFALARAERDAWLNWPARVSALLAAELGIDPHRCHLTIEREVHRHLEELGALHPRFD